MRIAAFIVFVISAWLTYGANSLHFKDPAHYGMAPVYVLFTIAAASGFIALFRRGKDKNRTR